MKKFLWLPLMVLAVAAWFFWPGSGAVEVVRVTRGPAVEAVYATGTVEATIMLPIAARVSARLAALNVDEGSNVTKDQVLAQLEDDDVQNMLEELQAKERFAKNEYDRVAALAKKGYESKAALDQKHSEWDAASAAVARAKAETNFTKLLAPADGFIIKRDGEIGQLIPANQPVFWLSCCAPLRVSAEVDEEDIARVKPGQEVLIRADAFPGKIFHGSVQAITPKGDPVARTYRVRIGFSEEVPLLIGMTAETNIIIGKKDDALLLPASVLKQNKLWLVKDGKLARQDITIGAKTAEQVEIIQGVTPEDVVVLKPTATLIDGARVRSRLVEAK